MQRLNDNPGVPGQGKAGAAEVSIFRENVGFRAHIEYRDGTESGAPEDHTFYVRKPQGARHAASSYMSGRGYAGIGTWETDDAAQEGQPIATRLFRIVPAEPS